MTVTTILVIVAVVLLYILMAGFGLSFWTGTVDFFIDRYPFLMYVVLVLWPPFLLFAVGTQLGLVLALSIRLSAERRRSHIQAGGWAVHRENKEI